MWRKKWLCVFVGRDRVFVGRDLCVCVCVERLGCILRDGGLEGDTGVCVYQEMGGWVVMCVEGELQCGLL